MPMKRQPRILAGTALGLLMASAPLGAVPLLKGAEAELSQRTATAASEFAPVIPAQSQCQEGETEEQCAQRLSGEQQQQAPAEEPAPAPEEREPVSAF